MSVRAAIYARVSTANQTQAQTIDQQLTRLQAHIQVQGWDLAPQHIFRDDGRSGADLNRPGLDHLRDAARRGEVDCALMTEPDRLARNFVQQMIVLDELERAGCRVEFLDRPMGQDPHDRLLLQIRGAVAEYERTLIADRMRRGRQQKYRAGVLLPWTRPPYGYRLSDDRPRDPAAVRVDEGEAAVIREIFASYTQERTSLGGLAKLLQAQGIPTPSGKRLWGLATVRAILRQPAYTGQLYAGRYRSRPARIRRSATHPLGRPHDSLTEVPPEEWIAVAVIPAIISQEQFDMAARKLTQNRRFAARNNTAHRYLLRALVSCGRCQSSCGGIWRAEGYGYYVCAGKGQPIHTRKEEKCSSRFSPAGQLDDLVWHDLCAVLTHPESITQVLERAHGGHWLPQEVQDRREQLRRARQRLGQQLERLTDAYLDGVIPLPEYQRRRPELEQRLRGLEQQEGQLTAQADRQAEVVGMAAGVEAFCRRVQVGLADATFEQKRQLVELLIDRVIVADGNVEIRYVIPTGPRGEQGRFCQLRTDYFGDPQAIGGTGYKRPLHQVGRRRLHRPALRGAGTAAAAYPDQAGGPHHARHPLAPAAQGMSVGQLRLHARGAVRPTAAAMDLRYRRRQGRIGDRPCRWRARAPGIVAAAGHPELPA
jgi:site-specific DNA recombinase